MKLLKYLFFLLLMLSSVAATTYEDGENGTANWSVYDDKPAGAYVESIYDDARDSHVIKFNGEGRRNAYLIGSKKGNNAWNNSSEKSIKWSMRFNEKFKISVYAKTKKGRRVFYFDYKNRDRGFYKKKYIRLGLGEESRSGSWIEVSRDLEMELQKYEPDNTIISLNGFKVQGSGKIDNLQLITPPSHEAMVHAEKHVYQPKEYIFVSYKNIDWFAVYPAGSSSDEVNILEKHVVNGGTGGHGLKKSFEEGEYELRGFMNDSVEPKTRYAFSVKRASELSFSVLQKEYKSNFVVQVKFVGVPTNRDVWIGIFPKGSVSNQENLLKMKSTEGKSFSNRFSLDAVPPGEYDVRIFFTRGYDAKGSDSFTSIDAFPTKISTNAKEYAPDEDILVSFSQMSEDKGDWIGLFEKESADGKEHALIWKSTEGKKWKSNVNMGKLPLGNYEARAYMKGSTVAVVKSSFSVFNAVDRILVQEAKDACLNAHNETKYIICSQEESIVYLMKVLDEGYQIGYKVYRINIADGRESIEKTIDSHILNDSSVSFRKLNNTSLVVVNTYEDHGDPFDVDRFYHQGKILQFGITYQGQAETSKLRGETKTIENGKKLQLTYHEYSYNRWIEYKDVYDIEDTSKVTRISHIEI